MRSRSLSRVACLSWVKRMEMRWLGRAVVENLVMSFGGGVVLSS